jgi:hypothetical protein
MSRCGSSERISSPLPMITRSPAEPCLGRPRRPGCAVQESRVGPVEFGRRARRDNPFGSRFRGSFLRASGTATVRSRSPPGSRACIWPG